MGLLRRLIGREPGWTERWELYPGTVGDQIALYSVDLGAVDAAPVERYGVRLDVDFTYPDNDDNGMPADNVLPDLNALDDAVRRTLKGLGGVYVGRVLSAGAGRITSYLPADPGPSPAIAAPPGLAPRVTVAPDPAWSAVREELAPDAWQRNVIEDNGPVRELENLGDRLDVPREIEHLAYFGDEERADRASMELRDEGFAVTIERDDEGEYVLQAVRRDAPQPPGIHEVTWRVRTVVEGLDGTYDGWGCTVQG